MMLARFAACWIAGVCLSSCRGTGLGLATVILLGLGLAVLGLDLAVLGLGWPSSTCEAKST